MDYPYLAGLIDGEGTITLTKERARSEFRRPVVSIQMTDYILMRKVYETFGGTLTRRESRKQGHSTAWTWKVVNRRAVDLLTEILPFLNLASKRTRASLIVNVLAPLTPRNGRHTKETRAARLAAEHSFFQLTPSRMSPI